MSKQSQQSWMPKKKYVKVSYELRVKLIELVVQDGLKISEAAQSLSIKYCTAKAIVTKFKKEGKITMNHIQKMNRLEKSSNQEKKQQNEVNSIKRQQDSKENINNAFKKIAQANKGTINSANNDQNKQCKSLSVHQLWNYALYHYLLTCHHNFAFGKYALY